MGIESILLGIAGIVLGIAIFVKTGEWIPSIIPTAIGIALLLFNREEDKIEKRKDINTKKYKK
jgi:hypothetical protein